MPAAKQAWEPGSVRLQSMETAVDKPVTERIKWAVGGEAVDALNTLAAPVPFETPRRRYTRPQADSTQSYLDRQANQD
jgi:hypothetical protein